MKLLPDENLSPRLIAPIDNLFPGSQHITECGLRSFPDDDVYYAKENGFAIVSKDSDFSERGTLRGSSPR